MRPIASIIHIQSLSFKSTALSSLFFHIAECQGKDVEEYEKPTQYAYHALLDVDNVHFSLSEQKRENYECNADIRKKLISRCIQQMLRRKNMR